MLHHVGLEVKDLERSVRFYRKAFGFEEEARLVLGGEKIVFLLLDGFRLELVEKQEEDRCGDGIHLSFREKNADEAVGRLLQQGAALAEKPLRLENGWVIAFVRGPDGEWIELIADGG